MTDSQRFNYQVSHTEELLLLKECSASIIKIEQYRKALCGSICKYFISEAENEASST